MVFAGTFWTDLSTLCHLHLNKCCYITKSNQVWHSKQEFRHSFSTSHEGSLHFAMMILGNLLLKLNSVLSPRSHSSICPSRGLGSVKVTGISIN